MKIALSHRSVVKAQTQLCDACYTSIAICAYLLCQQALVADLVLDEARQ